MYQLRKKNFNSVAIYGRSKELFRPPIYSKYFCTATKKFEEIFSQSNGDKFSDIRTLSRITILNLLALILNLHTCMILSCSLGLNNGTLYLHAEVWMQNHKKGKFPDLLFLQLLLLPIASVEASLRELMVSVQPERQSKNIYNCEDESYFCFKGFS